jgi:hypothetical protein
MSKDKERNIQKTRIEKLKLRITQLERRLHGTPNPELHPSKITTNKLNPQSPHPTARAPPARNTKPSLNHTLSLTERERERENTHTHTHTHTHHPEAKDAAPDYTQVTGLPPAKSQSNKPVLGDADVGTPEFGALWEIADLLSRGNKFSKVVYIVSLCSKYNRV